MMNVTFQEKKYRFPPNIKILRTGMQETISHRVDPVYDLHMNVFTLPSFIQTNINFSIKLTSFQMESDLKSRYENIMKKLL